MLKEIYMVILVILHYYFISIVPHISKGCSHLYYLLHFILLTGKQLKSLIDSQKIILASADKLFMKIKIISQVSLFQKIHYRITPI